MPIVNITIKNKIATPSNISVVCGNSDYTFVFNFDEEWNAYNSKTARFVWNGQYVDVAFNGNSCEMPVINDARYVSVGVYAGELHTTTPAILNAKKSILCDDPVHVDPPEDIYNQIMELLNRKQDDLNIENATVGQYARITEVDEHGKPVKWDAATPSGGGGSSTWGELLQKPFERIGENLKVVNGALCVDTAPNVEQDNTKPITSAAVYTEVGNINALLALI